MATIDIAIDPKQRAGQVLYYLIAISENAKQISDLAFGSDHDETEYRNDPAKYAYEDITKHKRVLLQQLDEIMDHADKATILLKTRVKGKAL